MSLTKVTTDREIENCHCNGKAELYFGYAGTMYTVQCTKCRFTLGGNLSSTWAVINWNESKKWANENLKKS